MSYQVLARKWRPRKFDDVVGQDHITRSLKNALKNKSIGHAYLFSGTRGIGKTSVARIFAKALTCLTPSADGNPCLECVSCKNLDQGTAIDVQEIDGASNNSVENIRQLVESAQYLPTSGSYKVYIIDEVHMLSTSAFNALLKTLEEPPAHVIFILATTDPEKLLDTVVSRCQRFDFRNATIETLFNHAIKLLKKEEVKWSDDELIRQICRQGKGSFRDTLSLIDQVLSFSETKTIDEKVVSEALGLAKTSSLKNIVNAMIIGETTDCIDHYFKCLNENVAIGNLTQGILDYLYFIVQRVDHAAALYEKKVISEGALDDVSGAEIFWMFETIAKDFTWALDSVDPESVVSVILQKVSKRREFLSPNKTLDSTQKKTSVEEEPKKIEINIEAEQLEPDPVVPEKEEFKAEEIVEEESVQPAEVEEAKIEAKQELKEEKNWEGFIAFLFKNYPAMAANLEQGNILSPLEMEAGKLYVQLGFDEAAEIFYDYLSEPQSAEKLKGLFSEYFDVESENITIELEKIAEEEKEEKNFQSRSEIADLKEEKKKEEMREKILSNPFVKEAEELFKSKVDKVVISNNRGN